MVRRPVGREGNQRALNRSFACVLPSFTKRETGASGDRKDVRVTRLPGGRRSVACGILLGLCNDLDAHRCERDALCRG